MKPKSYIVIFFTIFLTISVLQVTFIPIKITKALPSPDPDMVLYFEPDQYHYDGQEYWKGYWYRETSDTIYGSNKKTMECHFYILKLEYQKEIHCGCEIAQFGDWVCALHYCPLLGWSIRAEYPVDSEGDGGFAIEVGKPNVGSWYNFTMVHDGSNVKAYLNRELKMDRNDAYSGDLSPDFQIFIGQNFGTPQDKYNLKSSFYLDDISFKQNTTTWWEDDFSTQKFYMGFGEKIERRNVWLPKSPAPPIGDNPQQKYPFLHDANFENESQVLGSSFEPPARGTLYDSGQWYSGLSLDYSDNMYSKIQNNRLKLRAYQYHGNLGPIPTYWASAWAEQGRGPYGAIQRGYFKGSNDTEANAVDTPRIVFPMNETFQNSGSQSGGENTTIWLHIKARINRRTQNFGRFVACANLGFFCGFQYEFWNGTHYWLSDYDHETPKFGRHYALHYDIFLSRHPWYSDFPDPDPIGAEMIFWAGLTAPYDNDYRVQRVVGQMDVGIWYTFKLDFGYLIERAKAMIEQEDGNDGGIGSESLPDVTALVLRDLQIFAESCSAEIEAEVDYCFLIDNEDPTYPVTLNSAPTPTSNYQDKFTGQVAVWIDDTLVGTTPTSVAITDANHKFHVPDGISKINGSYRYYWDFAYWIFNYTDDWAQVWQNPTDMPFVCSKGNLTTVTAKYEYYKREYIGGGGGGGGGFCRIATMSPEEPPDYGIMGTFSNYANEYMSLEIRKTLGNINGTIALDVFTSHKEIWLDATNIEKVDLSLGAIWEENGRYDYMNPWSHSVDDITLKANIENVTQCTIIFRDVPNVIKVEKNHIEMEKGEFWEYKDGDLIIHLAFGDPDIFIDFETPISMMLSIIFICVIPLAIVSTLIAFVYRKMD